MGLSQPGSAGAAAYILAGAGGIAYLTCTADGAYHSVDWSAGVPAGTFALIIRFASGASGQFRARESGSTVNGNPIGLNSNMSVVVPAYNGVWEYELDAGGTATVQILGAMYTP